METITLAPALRATVIVSRRLCSKFAYAEFMSGELWSELHFDNCQIPAENVLLGPGGFKKQMASFNVERLGIGPQCGFASTAAGNPLTEADERAKLGLVVAAARAIWG